ncbi:MAG: hypothetical protein JWM56_862 [Candidatus Peribacteria bacterium]|nr:hypothetical protein [Candidatus Peribacteria bacterium]
MHFLSILVDLFLHLDKHLETVIAQYGALTYALLFLIILVETGLVIMPFLPGDSLLFAAGTFAAKGSFNIVVLFILLAAAAILGDTMNYAIGRALGPKVFTRNHKWLRADHLQKAQDFYAKYGTKTIIIARFIPIIRTFAPFVAGIGAMNYTTFITYNIVGGILWVGLFLGSGYFFGTIPSVEKNFSYVILAIIALSLLPPVYEYIKHKRSK